MTHPMLKRVFSEKFLNQPKYVLERDRPLPHHVHPWKACSQCGINKPNDKEHYPMFPYGDAKLGRTSTGPCCKECLSRIATETKRTMSERDADAERIREQDMAEGRYLAQRKL